MQTKLYNKKAEEIGSVNLPDDIFGLKWNADLVHQVVVGQGANRRPRVAKAKDRSEVRGGGKKPWRQKGTGRARHGSTRSPIWVGGGITHGPIVEKNYRKKINRKMAKKALYTVLSAKVKGGELLVVDDFSFASAKTKLAADMFKNFASKEEFARLTKGNGALVALYKNDPKTRKTFRNLPYVGLEESRNLTAYEVMQYKYLILSKDGVETFEK